jgi:hypothetical protein
MVCFIKSRFSSCEVSNKTSDELETLFRMVAERRKPSGKWAGGLHEVLDEKEPEGLRPSAIIQRIVGIALPSAARRDSSGHASSRVGYSEQEVFSLRQAFP